MGYIVIGLLRDACRSVGRKRPGLIAYGCALLIAALLYGGSTQSANSAVAFDNFGPGDTYTHAGWGIGDFGGAYTERIALVFNAGASGTISAIRAALNWHGGARVTLSLHESAGASPGSLLDSSSATVPSGGTLSFGGWTASITAGTEYWLVATVAEGFAAWWIAPPGSAGQAGISRDGGAWTLRPDAPSATRITVVPLPLAFPLLLSGLAALVFATSRERFRREATADRGCLPGR